MTWILGRTIAAGVIVLGIAGCAAPKNAGQTSKQVSGVPSTQVPHQVLQKKKAPQKEMSARETAEAKERGKKLLALINEAMRSKDVAYREMTVLAECSGFYAATADAIKPIKGTETQQVSIFVVSAKFEMAAKLFALFYSKTNKTIVNEKMAKARAFYLPVVRDMSTDKVLNSRTKACREKAGLVQVSVKLLTSLKEDQERDALNN